MANEQNLIPGGYKLSVEEQKKGGIASGKARRKKKALNETLNELFSMPLHNGKIDDIEQIQSLAAVKGQNITVQEAIVIAQIQRAIKGDPKAARLLVEWLGEQMTGATGQADGHNALIDAIRKRNSNED